MSDTRYRLVISATLEALPDIALALDSQFPQLAEAINKQWLEILNSRANVFGPFEHTDSEPLAGMTSSVIKLVPGLRE